MAFAYKGRYLSVVYRKIKIWGHLSVSFPFNRIAFSAVLALGFSASVSHAQSLQEELRGLAENHPQVTAANKTALSTGKEVNKAIANFMPTIVFTGDRGMENIKSDSVRGDIDWRRTVGTVTVTQNLFDGFSRSTTLRSARINKEIQTETVETTRQTVLAEAITAYIEVLKQSRMVELATENEQNIKRQAELEDERVRRGSGITTDVLEAKKQLQVAKERRVAFEGELQNAVSRYTQVFNRPPNVGAMSDPNPPLDLIPGDMESAIEAAVRGSTIIATGDLQVELQRELRKGVEAEYYPTVDLVGKASYESWKSTTADTQREYSLLLQATWNLFTGLSTKHSIEQSAFNYSAAQDSRTHFTRKIIELTRISWQNLLTARERMALLENAVNIAGEVFDSRQKLRDAGKETVINVLAAKNDLHDARLNYTAASYDAQLAIYQLLFAMGKLNDETLGLVEPSNKQSG